MRVLFYNHTGQVSGAERVLLMILSRLNREAVDPVVVCPGSGPLAAMVLELGVRVQTARVLEARFTWRVAQLLRCCKSFFAVIGEFRQRVKVIQPDLIHANSIRAGLVATAATVGMETRILWHLHDMLPRHPLSTLIRVFAALSSRAQMIAVSEAVGRNFRGRFRLLKNRVRVILNAIDLEQFKTDQAARRLVRRELRLRESDVLIGIVGQLTPRKGQLELLRAFAGALPEMPPSVLLVAGAPLFNRDHEYSQEITHASSQLGIKDRMRMLGARSDIARIMQSLDLLVVNSRVEPFGLVILEAMACGTPVLATAVDGIPEIIEHGSNGWLVPPQDERLLQEALVHLTNRPGLREQLAEKGKDHVAMHFSADRYLRELLNHYRAAISPTRQDGEAPAASRQTEATKIAEFANS